MKFTMLSIPGVWRIDAELREDQRGNFTRTFCQIELHSNRLESQVSQMSTSYNIRAKTLRGLHYQLPPASEVKMIRVLSGSVWDVVVDLRRGSPSFLCWHAEVLSAANRAMMYVPRGFAHGFITLTENTEILYIMSHPHDPSQERGLRWDDPAIGIAWPERPAVISARDESWPDAEEDYHGFERMRGIQ